MLASSIKLCFLLSKHLGLRLHGVMLASPDPHSTSPCLGALPVRGWVSALPSLAAFNIPEDPPGSSQFSLFTLSTPISFCFPVSHGIREDELCTVADKLFI